MSQDQQTYKRGANAALIGLIAQLLLAVGLALIGLYAQSATIHAATWYLFGGLPIWIILWIVYNSAKLERLEALEAEQLAQSDAQTAALFDEAGNQLAVARKRLEALHRFGLPITSLLVATYLLAMGLTLGWLNWKAYNADTLAGEVLQNENANLAAIAILTGSIAFIAFLVARYISGMTQVKEWSLLRGGAAYLIGNAVAAALLVVGALGAYFGNMQVLAVLAVVVPGIMALLGAEMVVGFTLSIYRPRRPGEIMRPAFDSRLLGWLSRPESLGKIVGETLNYQFGFEISKSWFYRLLARAVTPLVIVAVLVMMGLSSLVVVAPQQEAVITTFGKFERVVTPGAHLKWPWPIGKTDRYDVYRVHQISVGSLKGDLKDDVAILWTTEHSAEGEDYLLTAPTQIEGLDLELVAGELVGAEVVVKYRIEDLRKYVGADEAQRGKPTSATDPEKMLHDIAERRATAYFATHEIDTLLTRDREDAGDLLRNQIQQDVEQHNLGLRVVFVGLVGVHPPQKSEVASKFHEQIGALQSKESAVQDAEKEAVKLLAQVAGSREKAMQINDAIGQLERLQSKLDAQLRKSPDSPEAAQLRDQIAKQSASIEDLMDSAGGKAIQLIYDARAYRWSHAMTERARADRFASQLLAYRNAPKYYMMRRYLQTLAQGLKDQRKIIMAAEQKQPATIRLNLESAESGLESVFSSQ